MNQPARSLLKLAVVAAISLVTSAFGAVVTATFNSAASVPVAAAGYTASGNSVELGLSFAPPVGTTLMVVKNTGLAFISGQFSNLSHGQAVTLGYNGINYKFVANYFGGTGNDLVLQWASVKIYGWGGGGYGQLGTGNTQTGWFPTAGVASGALAGKTPTAMAMGTYHSLGVCADGTLAAWGRGSSGELGNGTTYDATAPGLVAASGVLSGKTVIAVTAAQAQSFFLCSDGTVASCGNVSYGLLGNSSTTNSLVPGAVTATGGLAGKTVVAIRAGGFHCLALCSDGTVASWGGNDNAQLGNGTSNYNANSVPVAVVTTGALAGKSVVAIAAGNRHNLALCADGTLVSWGYNNSGQLGNNSTSNSSVPVAITSSGALAGKTVTAVAASYNSSMALCADGTIVGWGDNAYGQLGTKSIGNSKVPFALASLGVLAGKTVTALSAGEGHCVAVCSDGTLAVWGGNTYGQLGTNNMTDSIVPVAVSTLGIGAGEKFIGLAAGPFQNFSLALAAVPPPSGNSNLAGLTLSSGPLSPPFAAGTTAYTANVGYATTAVTVTPTVADSTATIKVNGVAVTSAAASSALPLVVGANVINVVVTAQDASTKTYALTVTRAGSADASLAGLSLSTGVVSPAFASGTMSYHARLLHATSSLTVTPTVSEPNATVTVNGLPVVSGAASSPIPRLPGSHTLTILVTAQDGISTRSYTITLADDATLTGLGLSAGSLSPAFAPALTDYASAVSAATTGISVTPTAADPSASITVNGVAVASGVASAPIPLVVGDTSVTVVVTALDGSLTTYGITVTRPGPINFIYPSATAIPVTSAGYMATGNTVALALGFAPPTGTQLTVVNNTALALIQGTFGNLAQGQWVELTYGGVRYPFVANYYGGTGNDLVLQWARTKLYAWGGNGSGQVGDGTLTNRTEPTPVSTSGILAGKTVIELAEGDNHCLALCSDGTLAAWGAASSGQLGNNSTLDRFATPVAVVTSGVLAGKKIAALAGGGSTSFALCTDGTLAAWGNNDGGRLGNNSSTNSSVPVAVSTAGALAGKSVVAIAPGGSHNLALCSDGTVAAWGWNSYGQLGNGNNAISKIPIAVTMSGVLAGKSVIGIAAGDATSYALCADGTLAAWGINDAGQLGNAGTASSNLPVLVSTTGILAGRKVTALAAGNAHGLALCADGTLAAWGNNSYGQLGNNTTTNSTVPVAVTTSGVLAGKLILTLVGRNGHSVVLGADGTLTAWGNNAAGQLGDTRTTASSVPVATALTAFGSGEIPVLLGSGTTAVHSAVVAAVPLSGASSLSSLVPGTGSLTPTFAPGVTSYTARVPHGAATLALTPTVSDANATVTVNGVAVASGAACVPIPLPAGPIAVVVTAQNGSTTTYSVVAREDSSLAALSLSRGALNPSFSSNMLSYAAYLSPATASVTITATAADASATLLVNGVAVASGVASGPVALEPGPNVIPVAVTALDGSSTIYQITVVRQVPLVAAFGSAATVPVTSAGYVATANTVEFSLGYAPATGANLTVIQNTGTEPISGRFSNLSHGQRVTLTYNKASYGFVANYFGGSGNDLVLQWANTRLLAWGANTYGQLGDGSATKRLSPVGISATGLLAGKTVLKVQSGVFHTVALCVDGTLVVWGRNNYGQLGNGSSADSSVPVYVTTSGALAGKTVTDMATGTYHTLALCSDGTLAAWGVNDYGQLGNGTTTLSNVPVAVARSGVLAGKVVSAIAAGTSNCMALCTDGSLVAWGNNSFGQLGDGSTVTRTTPVAVLPAGALAGRTARLIATGYHNQILCTDGTLVGWGNNLNGQLGIGSTTNTSIPTVVTQTAALVGKTITALYTGSDHTLARCSDGTAAAWGDNYYGQLADATSTDRTTPVVVVNTGVLAGKTLAKLDPGWGHSLMLCADGTLAAAGCNSDGQIGNGSTSHSYGPTAVATTVLGAGEKIMDAFAGQMSSQSFALTALPLSTNSQLATLAVSGATLTPAFAPNTTTYLGLTKSGFTSLTVTPAAADAGATITVNGAPVASGTASAALPITPGLVIQIMVTAQDGSSTTYQIEARADSSLTALAVSAGALEPAFASGTTSYINYVPPETSSMVITPTAGDPAAVIEVNGATVASGAASGPVVLVPGVNPLTVKVTATDTSSTSYGMLVTRQVAVDFSYLSAAAAAVTANGYNATANTANLTLGFAPPTGTILTVVNNTGNSPITGQFSNLVQGQKLVLSYNNASYAFVADYYGGNGNDLVLRWAKTKAYAWGHNNNGQLGNGNTTNLTAPNAVVATGVLAGKTLKAVANGDYFTLALCTDGTLAAWGEGVYGQLGTGTVTSSSVPVLVNRSGVLAGKTVVAIAGGMSHSLALCSDGTLASWGKGDYGTLGNGGTTNSSVPVLVKNDGVLAGKRPIAIAAGMGQNLVLCADGALVAWGYGSYGQLGNGTFNDSTLPVRVVATGLLATKTVTSIASGSNHNLAVCSDGSIAVWGYNSSGEHGNGTTVSRNVPVAVTTSGVLSGRSVIRAAAGYSQSSVICADGTLAAWGSGTYGQLGQGSNSSSYVPVEVIRSGVLSGKTVAALVAGAAHHAVLCTDGTLATWGYNSLGQLGNGSYVNSNVPVLPVTTGMGAGEKFISVAPASAASHCTAIAAVPLSTNSQLATLAISSGTLMPGFAPGATDYALRLPPGTTSITVTPGVADSGSTVTVNGTALTSGTASAPVAIAGGAPVTIKVTAESGASTSYVLAVKGDSLLSGLTLSSGTLVPAFSAAVTSYDARVSYSTASITVTPTASDPLALIEVNGAAVTSGSAIGPVALVSGDNTVTVKVTATDSSSTSYVVRVARQVPLAHAFTSATSVAATGNGYVAKGNTVTLALGYAPVTGTRLTVVNNTGSGFIDGRFDNLAHGQWVALSYGGKTYQFVASYFGGSGNDLVLHWANVRLAGWGQNANGELGSAGLQYSMTPTPTATVGELASKVPLILSSGFQHSLALCADGSLAAWGINTAGQLGDGTLITRMVPVAVDRKTLLGGKTLVAIAAGGSHSLAAAEDGTVAAWGDNTRGQLGNGNNTQANSPVAVVRTGVLNNKIVRAVAAGGKHSLALCTDGTLAAWGDNSVGQLGNGSTTSSNVPVLVSMAGVLAGKTIVAIAAGASHSAALCADGTVACWGDNTYGQLGDNTTALKTTPVLVDRGGVLAAKSVVEIASGSNHLLARCADGTLAAWGYGSIGQLGTGAFIYQSAVPVAVDRSGVLSGKTAAALACGERHSLVANTDGTAAGWGRNMYGGLGNNGTSDSNAPVSVLTTQLASGERFIAMSGGSDYSMAMIASPPAPLVTTTAASNIDDTRATANGTVNANGSTASVWVEFGRSCTYGSMVATVPASASGTTETAVSVPLSGLVPGVLYHFRAIARTASGTVYGNDQTFTTTNLAALTGLSCDGGSLVPTFSPAQTRYLLTVPNDRVTLAVTPTAAADATLTVNGQPTASGSAASVPLAVGTTEVAVVVTAASGNARSYGMAVTRLPKSFLFSSATSVPVATAGFAASGEVPGFGLRFAPAVGTRLIVVNNTASTPIVGNFTNLIHGQLVNLEFGGTSYPFVVDYFGGDGNDLVLHWANTRAAGWGSNSAGELGVDTLQVSYTPVAVNNSGVLAGKFLTRMVAGYGPSSNPNPNNYVVVLASDGTLASWGGNDFGQLGDATTTRSKLPVAVVRSGVLADRKVVAMAAGAGHVLALCADGTLAAWGRNSDGQLGIGTTTNSSVPVAVNRSGVLSGRRIIAIAAGFSHSLVLCADGTLAAWGSNQRGQLGNATVVSSTLPVEVSRTGALEIAVPVAIAAGNASSYAVCADGSVAAWGTNLGTVIGTTDSVTPVKVTATGVLAGKQVVSLTTLSQHCVVLCSDGTLAAWGTNNYGQLGNNSTGSSQVPVLVAKTGALAGKTAASVATGTGHTMVVCTDGTLASWGDNLNGQLGDGTGTTRSVPVAVLAGELPSNTGFTAAAGRQTSSHALYAMPVPTAETLAATAVGGTSASLGGRIAAQGIPVSAAFEYGIDRSYGTAVVAFPATVSGTALTPVSATLSGLIPGTTYHFRAIATGTGGDARGNDMTFTTLSDNAWLANLRLDQGTLSPEFARETFDYLTTVPFAAARTTVTARTEHPGATVLYNGSASPQVNLAVGSNLITIGVTAQDGATRTNYQISVVRLPETFQFDSVDTVPVTADGFDTGGYPATVVLNHAPLPGTILTMVRNTGPGFIKGAFSNLTQGQRVGLVYDGKTYDFVVNYFGGTGNDLVLQWADTLVAAWGSNSHGQLGDATTVQRLQPTLIADSGVLAGRTVVAMAGGCLHSLVLTADGTLAASGYNLYGQLGTDGTAASNVPVAVERGGALAGRTVVAISAGAFHNLALCSDGSVVAWGYNNHGQLGTGDRVTARVPVRVNPVGALAGKQVVAVAAGAYHSFALCEDGTVAAWGFNEEGELGDGSTVTRLEPVAVMSSAALAGKQVAALAVGQYHTLAACSDGSLVSWGYNSRGQLGDNSTTSRSQPVAIGSFGALAGTTVTGISAGGSHSLASCSNGTVAGWGSNNHGELGIAGTVQSAIPIAVDLAALTSATRVAQVGSGSSHSLTRFGDGTLAAWGDNGDGQLGDDSRTSRPAPAIVAMTSVAPGTRVMAVAGGSSARHNLALVAMPAGATKRTLAAVGSVGLSAEERLIRHAFGLGAGDGVASQLPQPQRIGDDLVIRFTQPAGVAGVSYGAEWSVTMEPGSWQDVPDTGSGGDHRFAIPVTGAAQGFIRLKVAGLAE